MNNTSKKILNYINNHYIDILYFSAVLKKKLRKKILILLLISNVCFKNYDETEKKKSAGAHEQREAFQVVHRSDG